MESDDSDIGDMLDDLLANSDGESINDSKKTEKLKDLDFNFTDVPKNTKDSSKVESIDGAKSLVHEDNVDSSDDEDRRNFEEKNYSDFGRNLKQLLKKENVATSERKSLSLLTTSQKTEKPPETVKSSPVQNNTGFNFNKTTKQSLATVNTAKQSKDVYSDPVFGFRLTTPLISSAELLLKMQGRKAVSITKLKSHLAGGDVNDDWVMAGVLISKSLTKTTQKGTPYSIWKLSDLGESMYTVSMFLFSGAYKLFWKTATGAVIGFLNPNVMESKDNVDQATLSVDNAQKIMILGNSRDMAKCKSLKKNGDQCSNIVNASRCEYCVYHVKHEYNKASKRADLQSNGNSQGFSSPYVQKKKTVPGIYSQGQPQNFTPVYAKRNENQYQKDSARLAMLRGAVSIPEKGKNLENNDENRKKGRAVELTSNQVKKDLEKLNKLRGWNAGKSIEVAKLGESPKPSETSTKSLNLGGKPKGPKENDDLSINSVIPRLGAGIQGGSIDFTAPITRRHVDKARMNAIRWVKQNGALKNGNPNQIRSSIDKKLSASVKRQRENDEIEERKAKKPTNALNAKFHELLSAKSAHVDLINKSRDDDEEKYFDKLETREKMEEKMLTTTKIDCKAVKCLICKYTAFSAGTLCKDEKHPLKIVDATKNFFKCCDCGNRTICLDRYPSFTCKKCKSSQWMRTAMMDEKKINIPGAKLSIRGGEETFIGSVVSDANLDLLVPDSGA